MIKLYQTRRELYQTTLPINGIGAELGVADGTNALDLISITKPRKLFLCDPWPDHYAGAFKDFSSVSKLFATDKTVQIVREFDYDWLSTLENKFLDWAYLDTDHTYETTVKELNALCDKVRLVIAGHDFCCTAGTLHPFISGWNGGVMRAVIEAIQVGQLELIAITSPINGCSAMDGYPSWACRVLS